MTTSTPRGALRFGDWELRAVERELIVRGERVQVGSRAFDVLLALVERRGQVVTKDELLNAAWPGLVVEETNVSVQIAALRKLVGSRAIATVAGLGYRLALAADADVAIASSVDAVSRPGAGAETTNAASLPQAATDLIGRDDEVDELAARIGTAGLVSVVGTGGVGKTSLAKVVFAGQAGGFRDGTHWIDLAPLREAGQFVALVAKSLGVEIGSATRAREDLISALSHTQALVAVDNCEHLLDEVCAFVSEALEVAPGVRWLATSQEPLHVAGEVVYRLGPLELPATDAGLADAKASGAIALLCRRAAAADRRFELSDSNVAVAIELCRQLDGLPLAIEMAASRVAALGLQAVHEQLGQRLRLLAGARRSPPRHHTLRSTLDWSHDLLSEAERTVFRRLEPFLGGFELPMAQRLTCDTAWGPGSLDEWQALEALGSLIDKSLVQGDVDTPNRFFLFESAREYARLRLTEAGESEELRRRHAHVVAAAFASAQADFARFSDAEWSARYVPERHNVCAALTWACAAEEPDLLALLAAALAQIDSFIQRRAEILQYDVPMQMLQRADPALRAVACLEISWAHYADGSREKGTELALRALEDFAAAGDEAGEFRALAQLIRLSESRPGLRDKANEALSRLHALDSSRVPLRTWLSCTIGAGLQYERDRSVARLQELEDIARRAGYAALAAVCRVQITDELLIEGRFEEAVDACERFLEGDEARPRAKGLMLVNQALALVQLGRVGEAREPARKALRVLPSSAYVVADTFALAAAREGRWVEAALMAAYGARSRRERDESPDPAEATVINETGARLKAALAADRLAELTRMGSAMSTAAVLAIALPQ